MWLRAALLIIAGIVAYSNSLRAPFVLDDFRGIADNESIRQLWPPIWLHPPKDTGFAGRPVANFTLALNHAINGVNVRGYHILNVAIHITTGLLLMGVVQRTLRLEQFRTIFSDRSAGGPALIIALLWLVHPLHVVSVTFLSQRVELLMGMFFLLTLYAFVRGATAQQYPRLWFGASILACGLGMGSKEVMAAAPVVVALYDRTFLASSVREMVKRRGWAHLGLFATLAILIILVAQNPRPKSVGFHFDEVTWLDYAKIQCWAVVHYLQLAFWPANMVFDYGGVNSGVAAPRHLGQWLPQALGLLALAAAALMGWRRYPWITSCMAWFFLILAPSSSILPLRTAAAGEHRMYLPLASVVALAVLAGFALVRSTSPRAQRAMKTASLVIVAVCVIALGSMTRARNALHTDALALWADTVHKRPQNPRAHIGMGNALLVAGRVIEAIAAFESAVTLEPTDPIARGNLGLAHMERRQFDQAINQFDLGLKHAPDDGWLHRHRGIALLEAGRFAEARAAFESALAIDPADEVARRHLERGRADPGANTN